MDQYQAVTRTVGATEASFASFSSHYRLFLSIGSISSDLTAELDLKIFCKYKNILTSSPATKSVVMLPILRISP